MFKNSVNPVEHVAFPFYLEQLSVVLSLSVFFLGCHTVAGAAAAAAASRWQGVRLSAVPSGGACADKTSGELKQERSESLKGMCDLKKHS